MFKKQYKKKEKLNKQTRKLKVSWDPKMGFTSSSKAPPPPPPPLSAPAALHASLNSKNFCIEEKEGSFYDTENVYGDSSDDDDDGGIMNNPNTRSHFVHRYLSKEAMSNRLAFLVILGLLIIFIICVVNGGVLNGMEWAKEGILQTISGSGSKYKGVTQDMVTMMTTAPSMMQGDVNIFHQQYVNTVQDRMSGCDTNSQPVGKNQLKFLLLLSTTQQEVRSGHTAWVLKSLSHGMDKMGLNKTAVLWVWDDNEDVDDQLSQTDWRVMVVKKKNCTNLGGLILFFQVEMKCGSVLHLSTSRIPSPLSSSSSLASSLLFYAFSFSPLKHSTSLDKFLHFRILIPMLTMSVDKKMEDVVLAEAFFDLTIADILIDMQKLISSSASNANLNLNASMNLMTLFQEKKKNDTMMMMETAADRFQPPTVGGVLVDAGLFLVHDTYQGKRLVRDLMHHYVDERSSSFVFNSVLSSEERAGKQERLDKCSLSAVSSPPVRVGDNNLDDNNLDDKNLNDNNLDDNNLNDNNVVNNDVNDKNAKNSPMTVMEMVGLGVLGEEDDSLFRYRVLEMG